MKVWINGTFDVVHVGHLKLIEFASSYGDVTIGLDSDERVKKIKGNDRPFNSINDRIFFLESIKFVKNVISFDSDYELENMIKNFSPDFLVIGDDYRNKKIIGSEYAKNIIFFNKIPNYSTTNILNYGKQN
jgi:rfaE bifunctional protein nucleotidyltransferase chain/domain